MTQDNHAGDLRDAIHANATARGFQLPRAMPLGDGGSALRREAFHDEVVVHTLAALVGHQGKDGSNSGKMGAPKLVQYAFEFADLALKERLRRAGVVQPDATIWLRDLVEALDRTNWSSWQTTIGFSEQLNAARAFLATDGKEGGAP